jgi:hypothetical protein
VWRRSGTSPYPDDFRRLSSSKFAALCRGWELSELAAS